MRVYAFVGLAAIAAIASCDEPEPIGREPCLDSSRGDAGVTFAYSPALECTSRICLVEYGLGSAPVAAAVCTRECSSDRDCDTREHIGCSVGYGCGKIDGYPHAICACRAILDAGAP